MFGCHRLCTVQHKADESRTPEEYGANACGSLIGPQAAVLFQYHPQLPKDSSNNERLPHKPDQAQHLDLNQTLLHPSAHAYQTR